MRLQPDELAHKLDVLKGHCEDVGREHELEPPRLIGKDVVPALHEL